MRCSKSFILLVLLLLVSMVGCTPAATSPPATASTATATPPSATVTPALAEDASPWKVVLQIETEHVVVRGGFLNESFGITLSRDHHQGRVYYTNDGGKTWHRVPVVSHDLYGLDIVDENLVWAVGRAGHVRVSRDGAQNWQAVSNLKYGGVNEFVSFIDVQTGWAASNDQKQLWTTTDGGQTWAEISPPEGVGDFVAIALRTATDGYLLDNTGVLYTAQDGGQDWSSQTLELNRESMAITNIPHSAATRFFDADRGLVVLSLAGGGNSEVLAMRTTDGGQTWEEEVVPAPIGTLCLTHDGTLLTITSITGGIIVLRYQEHWY